MAYYSPHCFLFLGPHVTPITFLCPFQISFRGTSASASLGGLPGGVTQTVISKR